jgi:starch synthase
MAALRTLFAVSEAHPLIKTGGLGDVGGSLPPALAELGCDVRLVLPAYQDLREGAGAFRPVATLRDGFAQPLDILEGRLPGSEVTVWLVDHAPSFARPGNPYMAPTGREWPDNADRFDLFSRACAQLALDKAGLRWRADVVHAHDWQTGFVPMYLRLTAGAPPVVFTIHNLAYQGNYPWSTFERLGLPAHLWHADGLEFHGQMSFMKAGIAFSDRINTVSPNYAREIQTAQFGFGMDGLLQHRAAVTSGILNGIETGDWDPMHDRFLSHPFSLARFADKKKNKLALQRELGLPADSGVPLVGIVSRIVHQKGVDLVLDALPALMHLPLQMAVLGSGDFIYEDAWRRAATYFPDRLAVRIGYDEGLAHRIEAGADMFLMPSRFEPCGLNQMYSQRYGTVPIVRNVGGLADSVVDTTPEAIRAGTATGVMIVEETADAITRGVQRALDLYRDTPVWARIAQTGMRQDFSWRHSAQAYLDLYEQAVASRAAP